MATKVWNKNFVMFVAGWELSMIGSSLLRFVLPLYLLVETGSPALMGKVLALSFIPMIVVGPFGGVAADRLDKRKLLALINVGLALAVLAYVLISGDFDLVVATVLMLFVLFIFESFLNPAVEAAVPTLVPVDKLEQANSATFLLSQFSSIGAPMMGGLVLSRFGMLPILVMSTGLYLLAGIVKYMTKIPYSKPESSGKWFSLIGSDIRDALRFMTQKKPAVGRLSLISMVLGIVLYPIMTVALPILLTGYFGQVETAVGLMQGVVVLGGTVGVFLIGALGDRVTIKLARPLLFVPALVLVPASLAFILGNSQLLSYVAIVATIFVIFAMVTIFGIVTWSWLASNTPEHLLGKVISLDLSLLAIGTVIGNYLYGVLLGYFIEAPGIALLVIGGMTLVIALFARFDEG